MKYLFFTLIIAFAVVIIGCDEGEPGTRARFDVLIENLSGTESAPAVLLSNGIYFTQIGGHPLFFNFAFDYGDGLEDLAEDGIADSIFENIQSRPTLQDLGQFTEFSPGESISFQIEANYGESFNLAVMFTECNDCFYSFNDDGISLFEADGTPISGDYSSKLFLWDAGTEENEVPYEGEFQPARQTDLDQGVETPLESVRVIDDGFTYPKKTEVIRITFSPTEF